ncbi:hypothetical protein BMS3Abin07_01743 [bacterium BMS3Abin07]|nr:hypothetical protein BMS3Abin07_01743 [bacterium BMS3Abin07]GBE32695.1 hypothetical protein BMS3Bbin05_01612 [bacterium BMS3Bbin05]
MVGISDNAVKKFKEIIEQEGSPGEGIRIFLVPGG